MLKNRFDPEASAMSIPTDPHAVLEAITERNMTYQSDIEQGEDGERI
jgi:hypothetical protein